MHDNIYSKQSFCFNNETNPEPKTKPNFLLKKKN